MANNHTVGTKDLQKPGGIAALYGAAAYLAAMVFYLFILNYPNVTEPLQKVYLLVNNQVTVRVSYLISYVAFGLFLVILVLALYERFKASAPSVIKIATAFGLIWACLLIACGVIFNRALGTVVSLYGKDAAQAVTVWLGIESVTTGLSCADGEILGGLWTLLVSWAALQAKGLPKTLNYLGLVVGAIGVISIIPVLNALTGVFGIGQIAWFVWLGIVLLRSRPGAAV